MLLSSSSQLLDKLGQSAADRLGRIAVVWVRRYSLLFEVGPLDHHTSPFDVCLANNFFQEIVRVENLLAVACQDDQRLIEVIKQEFTSFDAPMKHDF